MGQGNPRKEIINPMGQHGKNDNRQAHGHSKKRSNWSNVHASEEIREGSTSLKAHTFHAAEGKHKHKRHKAEWDMARTVEMAWDWKKTDVVGNGARIQGLEHYLPIASQYKRGGPAIKGLRGCGLVVGEKGSILGFLPRLFSWKMLCKDDISPKRGKQRGWNT